MATYTKKELESFTTIHDALSPKVKEFVKRGNMTLNVVKREMKKFGDSNVSVLTSEFIGKQVLFNTTIQENILKTMNITDDEVGELISESPYFRQTFGRKLALDSQLRFAIPILIAVSEYLAAGKVKEAEYMFMIASYRPYATINTKYFPYGINDDRMRYVVSRLSNRYDIKQHGTVQAVIEKKAESAFNNYEKDLETPITDRNLHVIFNSGIYTRLNHLVQGMRDLYDKSEGEYMPFEKSTYEGKGDSEGEILDKDIQSDSSARSFFTRRAISKLMRAPVNEAYIDIAVKTAFGDLKRAHGTYSMTKQNNDMLKSLITNLVKHNRKELEWYIDSILSNFMNTRVNGRKLSGRDVTTAQFLVHGMRIITHPNTRDKNIIQMKESLDKFLEDYSIDYVSSGSTKKTSIRNALNMYILLMIQKG